MDSLYCEMHFLYDTNKFQNIIFDCLYNDQLYGIDLYRDERFRKKQLLFTDGEERHSDYKFDDKHRVIEETEYRKKQFWKRIEFRYY